MNIDHRPILTYFDPKKKKRKDLFRYDRRLKHNEEVKALVTRIWSKGRSLTVKQKLILCRQAIILWNRQQQKNSQELIENLKQELEEAMVDIVLNNDRIERANEKLKWAYKAEKVIYSNLL